MAHRTTWTSGDWRDLDAILARLVTAPVSLADRIRAVRSALAAMPIADGIRRGLDQKLLAALQSNDAGETGEICGPLTAFGNELSAQSGKKLTPEQAAALRSSLSPARAAGGCR